MHDEDCALGLSVTDKGGKSWTAYGDRRLLDQDNEENLKKCQIAVQTSAMEVYRAWRDQKVLPVPGYKAWDTVPTKESAMATSQKLPPLFLLGRSGRWDDLQRRTNIDDRSIWKHDTKWWVATTAYILARSKRWGYPMEW